MNVPHNLPVQLTSFVGRRKEMESLRQQLAGGTRLLTLTGPGGSGKTRMAVQLATEVLEQFPDGVYMADLSGLTDPSQVAGALAVVLKVREEPGRTPAEGVAATLASRRVLLLLDNCEHLVTASARLASTLLLECPQVQVVATSREPLGIAGEALWPVPTLEVPAPGEAVSAEAVTAVEAAALFIERARAVSPSFAVTAANAAALATVCRRLDGVPLAIELAAARTRLLSVEQIADRLDDRLRLLAGGRDALPRHQTLRAAIDWSYGLLTEPERVLWRRLSVFADRFGLEAAEAVCAGGVIDSLDVLELLAQLVDKSLVVAEEVRGEKRYRLLETIRQYGRERLRSAGEEAALLGAHRAWYVDFASQALQGWLQGKRLPWIEPVEQEQENLRQAVRWSLEVGEAGPALVLCGSLWLYWFHRAQFTTARALIERVLALADTQAVDFEWHWMVMAGMGMVTAGLGEFDEAERYYAHCLATSLEAGDYRGHVSILNYWGLLKLYRGQYPEAQRLLEEAITVSRAYDVATGIPASLINLSVIWADQGEFATARQYLAECDAHWRQLGHTTDYPPALEVLAGIALAEGDLNTAEALYEEALATGRGVGEVRAISVALTGLANVALLRREYGRCRELAAESVRLRQSVGDSLGQAASLETLAWLAAAEGNSALALRLAGGADAIRQRIGAPLPPVRRQRSERLLAPAFQALGREAAGQAFAAGARAPLPELVEQACAPAPAVTAAPTPAAAARAEHELETLTARELEIVRLAARGLTTREIGQALYLSPRTVEKHEENIRTKLNVPNRAALVVWAARKGLVGEAP